MGLRKPGRLSPGSSLSLRTANKLKRQLLFVKQKKATDKERREERFRRKKEERNDPDLRRQRLEANQPITLEKKRVWDDGDDDHLGAVVDVAQVKRRRVEEEESEANTGATVVVEGEGEPEREQDGEVDSMLGSDEEIGESDEADGDGGMDGIRRQQTQRDTSMAPSTTSTNLDLTPASLALKFPTLFADDPPPQTKILITTSLNSTLHHEAEVLCDLFPNATYIRRSAHRYGHKYSVREIAKFASNRGFTALLVLREDSKQPTGLSVVHLPAGPSFFFSISSWVEGKKLPGHGNPSNHYPELLLNGFRTPLGLLTARMLQRLFPPQPECQGRQVVAIHNQRDYLFVRRWRYKFDLKRSTEKSAVGIDGKEIPGMEDIRARLQVLGPNFCMKLRKVYKGVGLAGSEGEDAVPWEFKPKMEKERTRFSL